MTADGSHTSSTTELSTRYRGWDVVVVDLGVPGEAIDLPERRILVSPGKRGQEYAIAHAVAHLTLGHVDPEGGGVFTADQERAAHELVQEMKEKRRVA